MSIVSVIIPAYNKSGYTCRAVESVLNQTYKDIELIVVDDGSTDDTHSRLSTYGDRIRYIRQDNGGACSARNHGIRVARGEYIAFMDCDDMYAKNKIEASVKYLRDHPEVGFLHTAAHFIDSNDQTVGFYSHAKSFYEGSIARRLIFGNYICNSTVMVRRSCLDVVGVFDESIFTSADWDLWLRLAEHNRVGYINIPLTKYRISDNYIFNRLDLAQREEILVIEKYCSRNPDRGMREKVLSYLHLRFAECYFIKDDDERMKSEFKRAVALYPCNWKALALFFLYMIARVPLKSILRQKILRHGQENHKLPNTKPAFIQ